MVNLGPHHHVPQLFAAQLQPSGAASCSTPGPSVRALVLTTTTANSSSTLQLQSNLANKTDQTSFFALLDLLGCSQASADC